MSTFLVFFGAGLGGVLRHGVNVWAARFTTSFPWATFCVNVLGSFAMGVLMGVLIRRGGSDPWRLFLGTGLLGGFTTFSAFSLDVATLIDRGALATALAYALGSVAISLVALYAGFVVARAVSL
jgi:fluoride exporter